MNSGRNKSRSCAPSRRFDGLWHGRLREVDGDALAVGDAAVVEGLEQHIDHG